VADIGIIMSGLPQEIIVEFDRIDANWKVTLESRQPTEIEPFKEIIEKSPDPVAAEMYQELWEHKPEPDPESAEAGPTFEEDGRPGLREFLASDEFKQVWLTASAELEQEVLEALGVTVITEDMVDAIADAVAEAFVGVVQDELSQEETWDAAIAENFG
jgi:hypothetical protein